MLLHRTASPRDRARPGGSPRLSRVGRIAGWAAIVCLIPVLISYAQAVTQASNASLGIRTVEWLRDNGARALVNRVEQVYYSISGPSTGGPGLHRLPHLPGALGSVRPTVHHVKPPYRPPNLSPVLGPALPGEGVWQATYGPGGARPPVLITSYRPDPNYPRLVAGVAWIDHARTSTRIYPGRLEPNVAMADRGPEEVPLSERGHLVATFNSGFKLNDSGGGFVYDGHTYAPLTRERATFVRYRDGRVDILSWSGGPDAPPDVLYARQNLPLIVNDGRANPNLSDGPEWGATLGNKIRVWRSAVGVDTRGNLIYAAANDQTVGSLAAVMIHAGAVRAMELDINTYWTSFITYTQPGAHGAANLLTGMDRSPQRYLTPEDRDFFAVYAR